MDFRYTSSVVLICVYFVSIFFLHGCTAFHLPEGLTASEHAFLDGIHFDVSVGVIPRERVDYHAASLTKNLRNTGLFNSVKPNEDFLRNPDILVEIDHTYPNDATIPIVPAITLGIIPSFEYYRNGVAFWLYAPGRAENRIHIDFLFESKYVIGGLAGFLNTSPDWTSANVEDSQRFIDHFTLAIAKHAADIQNIIRHE